MILHLASGRHPSHLNQVESIPSDPRLRPSDWKEFAYWACPTVNGVPVHNIREFDLAYTNNTFLAFASTQPRIQSSPYLWTLGKCFEASEASTAHLTRNVGSLVCNTVPYHVALPYGAIPSPLTLHPNASSILTWSTDHSAHRRSTLISDLVQAGSYSMSQRVPFLLKQPIAPNLRHILC